MERGQIKPPEDEDQEEEVTPPDISDLSADNTNHSPKMDSETTDSEYSDWDTNVFSNREMFPPSVSSRVLQNQMSETSDEELGYVHPAQKRGFPEMFDSIIDSPTRSSPDTPKKKPRDITSDYNPSVQSISSVNTSYSADSALGGSLYSLKELPRSMMDSSSSFESGTNSEDSGSPVHNAVYGRYQKFQHENLHSQKPRYTDTGELIETLVLHRLPGENLGMILGIEGGKDGTGKVVGVSVKSVTLGGAAYRSLGSSKGICVGDEIWEVNGMDLRTLSHDECITVLKEMPLRVTLTVLRGQKDLPPVAIPTSHLDQVVPSNSDDDDLGYREDTSSGRHEYSDSEDENSGFVLHEVEINKEPSENLGLSIVPSYGSTKDYYQIKRLLPSGAGAKCCQLCVGDRLVSCNGISLRGLTQNKCLSVLKKGSSQGYLQLEILRPINGSDHMEISLTLNNNREIAGFTSSGKKLKSGGFDPYTNTSFTSESEDYLTVSEEENTEQTHGRTSRIKENNPQRNIGQVFTEQVKLPVHRSYKPSGKFVENPAFESSASQSAFESDKSDTDRSKKEQISEIIAVNNRTNQVFSSNVKLHVQNTYGQTVKPVENPAFESDVSKSAFESDTASLPERSAESSEEIPVQDQSEVYNRRNITLPVHSSYKLKSNLVENPAFESDISRSAFESDTASIPDRFSDHSEDIPVQDSNCVISKSNITLPYNSYRHSGNLVENPAFESDISKSAFESDTSSIPEHSVDNDDIPVENSTRAFSAAKVKLPINKPYWLSPNTVENPAFESDASRSAFESDTENIPKKEHSTSSASKNTLDIVDLSVDSSPYHIPRRSPVNQSKSPPTFGKEQIPASNLDSLSINSNTGRISSDSAEGSIQSNSKNTLDIVDLSIDASPYHVPKRSAVNQRKSPPSFVNEPIHTSDLGHLHVKADIGRSLAQSDKLVYEQDSMDGIAVPPPMEFSDLSTNESFADGKRMNGETSTAPPVTELDDIMSDSSSSAPFEKEFVLEETKISPRSKQMENFDLQAKFAQIHSDEHQPDLIYHSLSDITENSAEQDGTGTDTDGGSTLACSEEMMMVNDSVVDDFVVVESANVPAEFADSANNGDFIHLKKLDQDMPFSNHVQVMDVVNGVPAGFEDSGSETTESKEEEYLRVVQEGEEGKGTLVIEQFSNKDANRSQMLSAESEQMLQSALDTECSFPSGLEGSYSSQHSHGHGAVAAEILAKDMIEDEKRKPVRDGSGFVTKNFDTFEDSNLVAEVPPRQKSKGPVVLQSGHSDAEESNWLTNSLPSFVVISKESKDSESNEESDDIVPVKLERRMEIPSHWKTVEPERTSSPEPIIIQPSVAMATHSAPVPSPKPRPSARKSKTSESEVEEPAEEPVIVKTDVKKDTKAVVNILRIVNSMKPKQSDPHEDSETRDTSKSRLKENLLKFSKDSAEPVVEKRDIKGASPVQNTQGDVEVTVNGSSVPAIPTQIDSAEKAEKIVVSNVVNLVKPFNREEIQEQEVTSYRVQEQEVTVNGNAVEPKSEIPRNFRTSPNPDVVDFTENISEEPIEKVSKMVPESNVLVNSVTTDLKVTQIQSAGIQPVEVKRAYSSVKGHELQEGKPEKDRQEESVKPVIPEVQHKVSIQVPKFEEETSVDKSVEKKSQPTHPSQPTQIKPLSQVKPLSFNPKSLSLGRPVTFKTAINTGQKPHGLSTLGKSSLLNPTKVDHPIKRMETMPFEVSILKGILGIGIKVVTTPEGHVKVTEILPSGPVGREGNIKVGDYLLSINNTEMTGLPDSRVQQILRLLPRGLSKIVASPLPPDQVDLSKKPAGDNQSPLSSPRQSNSPTSPQQPTVGHVSPKQQFPLASPRQSSVSQVVSPRQPAVSPRSLRKQPAELPAPSPRQQDVSPTTSPRQPSPTPRQTTVSPTPSPRQPVMSHVTSTPKHTTVSPIESRREPVVSPVISPRQHITVHASPLQRVEKSESPKDKPLPSPAERPPSLPKQPPPVAPKPTTSSRSSSDSSPTTSPRTPPAVALKPKKLDGSFGKADKTKPVSPMEEKTAHIDDPRSAGFDHSEKMKVDAKPQSQKEDTEPIETEIFASISGPKDLHMQKLEVGTEHNKPISDFKSSDVLPGAINIDYVQSTLKTSALGTVSSAQQGNEEDVNIVLHDLSDIAPPENEHVTVVKHQIVVGKSHGQSHDQSSDLSHDLGHDQSHDLSQDQSLDPSHDISPPSAEQVTFEKERIVIKRGAKDSNKYSESSNNVEITEASKSIKINTTERAPGKSTKDNISSAALYDKPANISAIDHDLNNLCTQTNTENITPNGDGNIVDVHITYHHAIPSVEIPESDFNGPDLHLDLKEVVSESKAEEFSPRSHAKINALAETIVSDVMNNVMAMQNELEDSQAVSRVLSSYGDLVVHVQEEVDVEEYPITPEDRLVEESYLADANWEKSDSVSSEEDSPPLPDSEVPPLPDDEAPPLPSEAPPLPISPPPDLLEDLSSKEFSMLDVHVSVEENIKQNVTSALESVPSHNSEISQERSQLHENAQVTVVTPIVDSDQPIIDFSHSDTLSTQVSQNESRGSRNKGENQDLLPVDNLVTSENNVNISSSHGAFIESSTSDQNRNVINSTKTDLESDLSSVAIATKQNEITSNSKESSTSENELLEVSAKEPVHQPVQLLSEMKPLPTMSIQKNLSDSGKSDSVASSYGSHSDLGVSLDISSPMSSPRQNGHSDNEVFETSDLGGRGDKPSSRKAVEEMIRMISTSDEPVPEGEGDVFEVTMQKGVTGLGFVIQGGKGSPRGDVPLSIRRIFKGGPAEQCGQLQVKDEILKVNGEDITGMRHNEAWTHLKFLPDGEVRMLIRRYQSS